jgi:hypothetical protein
MLALRFALAAILVLGLSMANAQQSKKSKLLRTFMKRAKMLHRR